MNVDNAFNILLRLQYNFNLTAELSCCYEIILEEISLVTVYSAMFMKLKK